MLKICWLLFLKDCSLSEVALHVCVMLPLDILFGSSSLKPFLEYDYSSEIVSEGNVKERQMHKQWPHR